MQLHTALVRTAMTTAPRAQNGISCGNTFSTICPVKRLLRAAPLRPVVKHLEDDRRR